MDFYRYLEIEERNKFTSKSTDIRIKKIENPYHLPFEYIELKLCKLFNCLPSQLRNEDYSHLLKIMALDDATTQYQNWMQDDKLPVRLKLALEILKLEKA